MNQIELFTGAPSRQQKYLLALQRRAKGQPKVKAKITNIKKKKVLYDWLSQ